MMEVELNFPNASAELAQLLGVDGRLEAIDDFLTNWGLMAFHSLSGARVTAGDYRDQQILDILKDAHTVGAVMAYQSDEDEEE